jgi:hypothetical protein
LFGGIFETANERKFNYQEMRETHENFVELFAILRKFVQSGLSYTKDIKKNAELVEWSSSPVLSALAKFTDLAPVQVYIRGAFRDCLNYFIEHNSNVPNIHHSLYVAVPSHDSLLLSLLVLVHDTKGFYHLLN